MVRSYFMKTYGCWLVFAKIGIFIEITKDFPKKLHITACFLGLGLFGDGGAEDADVLEGTVVGVGG